MSVEIKRDHVDWERASCRGLDTNLFYLMRSDLIEEGFTYNHLRRMCFGCPIFIECLQIGTKYERYGFWGGMSEDERTHVYEGRQGRIIQSLKKDLFMIEGNYRQLETIVKSVTRVFGEFDRTAGLRW